jgi:hypothetical protein
MKSEERNCKSDLSEGEGKMWDPNHSLEKINLCSNKASIPHAQVMKPKCVTITEDVC